MNILRNKIILVAGADQGSREAVVEEFRKAGSQVLSSTGGIEAYEIVRARHVDAVLGGARLTSGSPFQLLAEVRRLNHDIPVILFGAAGEEITQTEALHRGFAAYFLQAFPTSVLAEATVRSLDFVEERKKKKVERVAVAAFVELVFGEPSVKMSAPVLNLSRGGMFLSLEKSFPAPMSIVDFRLSLTKNQPESIVVEGKALVRWVRERSGSGHLSGVGLEFIELSDQARVFVNAYVDRTTLCR